MHGVEVPASSLYEAAALAIGEFRRCGFTTDMPGPATWLTVTAVGGTITGVGSTCSLMNGLSCATRCDRLSCVGLVVVS
jgi:hypothetical protein